MNIPDHDSRSRDPVKSAYHIPTLNGSIVCVVGGLRLVDFYRSPVLAGPQRGSGDALSVSEGTLDGAPDPAPVYNIGSVPPEPEKPKESK